MAEIRTATRFTLIAIEDGVQVSGTLRADGSLSQNINLETGTVVPDWATVTGKRPTIYPVILKGSQYILPVEGSGRWLYNEQEIAFNGNLSTDGKFEKTTRMVGDKTYEALKIVKNLASEENIDIDTICYEGKVNVGHGNTASFHAEIAVRIATMAAGGFLAIMSPEAAVLTDTQTGKTLRAYLYDADGKAVGMQHYTKWYVNGEYTNKNEGASLWLGRDDVDDHAVVECVFHRGNADGEVLATAIGTVDDTTDPYELQIGMSSVSGTDTNNTDHSGILHANDSIRVWAWFSKNGEPSTIYDGFNINNISMKIAEYNGNNEKGNEVNMTKDSGKKKFYKDYSFAEVRDMGGSLTGVIIAQITE